MKIKELKEILNTYDDNQEVLAEDKITGELMGFETIMGFCASKDGLVIYLR